MLKFKQALLMHVYLYNLARVLVVAVLIQCITIQ